MYNILFLTLIYTAPPGFFLAPPLMSPAHQIRQEEEETPEEPASLVSPTGAINGFVAMDLTQINQSFIFLRNVCYVK